MILGLYRLATGLAAPLVRTYLGRRRRRGKESGDRFSERLGYPSVERPRGPLVWLHAASVGEALSLLPLIDAMLAIDSGLGVLMTTGTVTSAELMERRLPGGVIHQFVPVDLPKAVARFVGYWRPDLAIWAESEIWPNLLQETRAAGTTMVLVNGRMSERSFARWRRLPRTAERLFSAFDLVFGQSAEDTDRLRDLGAARAECVGNLKYAAPPLPGDAAAEASLGAAIGNRPAWMAACTHAGEDASAGRVHQRLAKRFPGLLTLVVPRHPVRGDEAAADLQALGLAVGRRSRGELPDAGTEVYLCDTLGEMGVLYRTVPVVAMGKSWIGSGGQNPLEPARLDCAVLFGPKMDNFRRMAERMVAAGAARQFADEDGLAGAVADLLTDPAARTGLARRAAAFAGEEAESITRVMARIAPIVRALSAGGEGRP